MALVRAHLAGVLKTSTSNYRSICRVLDHLEAPFVLIDDNSQVKDVSHIIVPGVSKFGSLMRELDQSGFIDPLINARSSGKAILGLCAGMQVMGKSSSESVGVAGLAWFDFGVTKIRESTHNQIRSFHTGWDDVSSTGLAIEESYDGCYYFNHSYYITECNPKHIMGTTEYGENFISVMGDGNILGAQFHPEKSQKDGLRFMQKFLNMKL
jgi:glutamine amidotransferase